MADLHSLEIEIYREALRKILTTEYEGSCCGCSGDSGFDKVQEIAQQALDDVGKFVHYG